MPHFFLTVRVVLCMSLLGLTFLFSGCDSGGSGDEEGFLLEPISNSLLRFQFPEDGDRTETLSFTRILTFTTDRSAFEGSDEVTLEAAETLSIPDFLTLRGYTIGALREARVSGVTITIESPAEETLGFIKEVLVEVGSETTEMQPVAIGGYFCCGNRTEPLNYQSDFYELAHRTDLVANLHVQTRRLPDTSGDYTFTIRFEFDLTVGTSPPAPNAITLEDAFHVRQYLQYQRFDVGDVLEAHVVGVHIEGARYSGLPYATPMSELARRIQAMTITVQSVEEASDRRELARFDPFASNTHSVSRTDLDLDITDFVRRAGRFELVASLTLEPSVGYRGETYAFTVRPIIDIEVRAPSSGGDTSP